MCRTMRNCSEIVHPPCGIGLPHGRKAARAGALVLAASLLAGPPAGASPIHTAHGPKHATSGTSQLVFQLQGSGGRGG